MITIAQATEEVVSKSPFIAEVLFEDIANISSIARRIKPNIEKRLFEKVSEESIGMALHRIIKKKKPPISGIKFLKDLSNITVRSNLIEFVFPSSFDSTKVSQKVLKKIKGKNDVFFNMLSGLLESIVIVSLDL